MEEIGKSFGDALKTIAWAAGVLFRQFELGREGYLPELTSEEGQKVVREAKEEAKRNTKTEKKPKTKKFPMGFA